MKRLLIHLEDEEYEKLKKLKERYGKPWKEFVMGLAEIANSKEDVPKKSIKNAYLAQAKALSELGKLLVEKDDGFDFEDEFYLASLLPLLISGEKVPEEDFVRLGMLMTNVVFNHLKEKYKDDESLWLMLEYNRVAIIRALKKDLPTYLRFMDELCKELGKLSLPQ